MRIRSTKPEFWRSKTIAAVPWDVRLVLKGLESYVDDNGVGKDDIALIAADVFPRDLSANARDTLARLSEAISTLISAGLVVRYEVDDEALLYIDRWKDIQRIDKPAKGRYPRPDGSFEYSETVNRESYANPRETVASPPETLAPVTGEQGNRGTEEKSIRSAKPSTPDLFDEFWAVYPKRVAKVAARRRWDTLIRRGTDPQEIINGAKAYAAQVRGTEPQFIKQPDGWLNAGRWQDEVLPAAVPQRPARPHGWEFGQ